MIARLPIRLRLTLPFAVVMAVALAATGFFIYRRVGNTLLSSIDQSLRGQSVEAVGRVGRGHGVLDRESSEAPSVGQIVLRGGRARDSTPSNLSPLLSRAELRAVIGGRSLLRSSPIAGLAGEWRMLAAPARLEEQPVAVVVATSLDSRDEALDRLLREFLIGGPAALVIAVLAGYALAAAALRPVEAMRRRAASIGAATPGSRLPTPQSRDEISRLAETLNDMLARLEASFEHERRFVDDASHELRTPLALLQTELELALRRPRSRAELEGALRSAAADTARLSRLAEDLLLAARFDQRRLPLRTEAVEARSLLADVASRYEPRVGEAGREIRVEAPARLLVDGDVVHLEHALGNLVENALRHGAGAIVLSACRRDGRVELHVTDEGAGLPPEFLPRALDRFSRADEARGRGGAGLGLAIVDLVARAHGGEAGVTNRAEAGADAWIAVPAAHSPR